MPCEYCTGSRWLLDDECLGPCVCVTPEAMRELDARQALDEEYVWTAEQYQTLLTDVAKAVDALHDYMRSIGASPDALRHDNPYFDALVDAIAVCEGYE